MDLIGAEEDVSVACEDTTQFLYELLFIVWVVVIVISSANVGIPWFILSTDNVS